MRDPDIEHFDTMGRSYIQSSVMHPSARDEEWQMLSSCFDPTRVRSVIDYACGAGFVTGRILAASPSAQVCGVDSSETMLRAYRDTFHHNPSVQAKHVKEFVGIGGATFDLAVCLGGLHHIQDPIQVIGEIAQRLRRGGMLVFADFEDGTSSQRYFDGLVNQFNPHGHIGLFISQSRAQNIARACGVTVKSYEQRSVSWRFASESDALEFVRTHHGLVCATGQVRDFLQQESMLAHDQSGWVILHQYALFVLATH